MASPSEPRFEAPVLVDPTSAAGAAFRVFLSSYPAMLAAWALPALVALVTNIALRGWAAATGFPYAEAGELTPTTGVDPAITMRFLGIALPLAFLMAVTTLTSWGVVARIVHQRLRPDLPVKPIPWGPLVVLAMALSALYAVGFVMLIVGFLVFLHWFMFAPAILAERGAGVGSALEESRKFSRERRTYGFTALIVLTWVGLLFAALIINVILSSVLRASGVSLEMASDIGGAVSVWLTAALLPAMPAAFWALAQQEARAPLVEDVVQETTAPAAPVTAAQRFRTTKCPQCGTLVPYTSTGKPIDVTCPVCNRSGRVL